MTTATPPASHSRVEQFLGPFEREVATTLKVLRAYPDDKLDLKPAEMSKTAQQLAWLFVAEMGMLKTAVTTGFDWSKPLGGGPKPPGTMAEIVAALDAGHKELARVLRETPEDQLPKTVRFFVAPKTMGDIPTFDFLWFLLHDHIHHRGQFSIYLRMAGGKVPSIYGPTADEPWT